MILLIAAALATDCPERVAMLPGATTDCVGVLLPPEDLLHLERGLVELDTCTARVDLCTRTRLEEATAYAARVAELEAYARDLERAEKRQRVRAQLTGAAGVVVGVAGALGAVWAAGQLR